MSAAEHEAGNLVAGRVVGGERYQVFDPGADGTVVGAGYAASGQTVADAVDAAAQAAPGWAATPIEERIVALTAARDRLVTLAEHAGWAELLTSEQGKIVAESRFETGRAPALVDLFSELTRAALEPDVLVDDRGRREVTHEPVGPVAAITPWNWPVSLSLGKVVPALLAGNPVVLKPAPNTPLAITAIVSELAAELPAGTLGVLQGGGDVGAALVGHPDIRKVVFTGSTANGARVYAAAADGIKNVTLELGGNDAALVLEDADLSGPNIASMIRSTFVTSGQVCWAIKRIYVHSARLAEFTKSFHAAVDALDVGHGLDPQATMGPLNNSGQLAHVRDLIRRAEKDGATVTSLGARRAGAEKDAGNYHQPTVVSDIGDTASLVAEEQFGPVVPVLSFDDDADAVRRANATPYGLCASVWSADREHAFSVARGLAAGQVYVNVHASAALDYTQPFGGVRQSGVGREFGVDGVRQYTEQRMISERSLR